jgi:AAA ATPase domain
LRHTRPDVSHARGFSKFVGRQSEMAALDAALQQAIAGNAQVVGVVAEAGTGKSRLCYEFAERCRAREIPVYGGTGLPTARPYPCFLSLSSNAATSVSPSTTL